MNDKNKKVSKKENDLRKQTIKNIVFKVVHGISYFCTGLFVAVCIVACATQNKSKASADTSSVVVERVESPKCKIDTSESVSESEVSYPIYDDLNYKIILSDIQLNNYTWNNLAQTINDGITHHNDTSIEYMGDSFIVDEIIEEEDFMYYYGVQKIVFWLGEESSDYATFQYLDNSESEWSIFEDNIQWSLNVNNYSVIKSAIQLDIQANEKTIDVGIFEGLTTSITSFITTLNTGLSAIIGIFWNDGLTPLGILSTLVVGVALVYFIFRLVIGLIRLRG